jgi:hypothetical protein
MTGILAIVAGIFLVAQATQPATPPSPGDDIAAKIVQASGGDAWAGVRRIRFTYNVEQAGKLVTSRKHDWDVKNRTASITVDGKTHATSTDRKAVVAAANAEASQVYLWHANDSFWLLAPLKLMDAGITREMGLMTMDYPPSRGRMRIGFADDCLPPAKGFDLAMDLRRSRIDHWQVLSDAGDPVGYQWDKYQDFNGLLLSTERTSEDGSRRVFFTDIVVERE